MKTPRPIPRARALVPARPQALASSSGGMLRKSTLSWLGQRIRLTDMKFWAGFFGGDTWAGEPVTPASAMQISAVWRAIRLTAETIASLPLNFYIDTPKGPQLERGGPTDQLLRVSPNDEQTPMEFWEALLGCMDLVGDGMARIHFIGRRPVALTLMDPTRTVLKETVQGGWEFHYTDNRGHLLVLQPREVFHLKGFTMGGPRGMSTVSYGAQTFSLSRASEKVQGKLFSSGLRSSGFVNTGQVLEEPDRARLNKILKEYTGTDAAGGIMLLEGGMTYTPLSMNSRDAELLLTRKWTVEEIGRWFGMPPILLGHAVEGQTMWGSGVDSIIQAWQTLGLRQRLVRVQQMVAKRLMTPEEKGAGLYAKYNPDALLAVNSQARATMLATLVDHGLLTRDEGRALLERGAIEGGDVATAQVNLVPLTMLGQTATQGPAQARAALRSFLGLDDAPPSDPAERSGPLSP